MKYADFRENRQHSYDEWANKYAFYAFSDEQFEEGMKKLGLTMETEDLHKIYRGPGGLFYLKEGSDALKAWLKSDNIEDLIKQDDEFALDAFRYEMNNHEYFYNYEADYDVCSCFCNCEYGECKDYKDYLKEGGFDDHVIDLYKQAKRAIHKEWEDNNYF